MPAGFTSPTLIVPDTTVDTVAAAPALKAEEDSKEKAEEEEERGVEV